VASTRPPFALVWTATFERTARKFLRRHPEQRGMLADVFRQLERDPRSPRLRLHPWKGSQRGWYALSLTYDYRIVLVLRLVAREAVLLDIGTHDEVYRE
jgi:mRNA-degrading endonuclease YafQ of YafQ-DinJ toxin-antitoxin module